VNAIILAGGLSRRMNGTRKAFLPIGDETFIERILRLLAPHFDTMFIVTNEPDLYARFDARVVRDQKQGMGPLMGMYSGLRASGSDASFVTAVDTPLVSPALARLLMEIGDGCDARVPRWGGRVEPLCAVYSRRCLPAIESVLGQGKSATGNTATGRIVGFFPLVRACYVEESAVRALDPQGLSFFNVNTPQDYDALRAIHTAQLRE
jgi:molybdopterin-guanine dinucleotide biosynthesis protein A